MRHRWVVTLICLAACSATGDADMEGPGGKADWFGVPDKLEFREGAAEFTLANFGEPTLVTVTVVHEHAVGLDADIRAKLVYLDENGHRDLDVPATAMTGYLDGEIARFATVVYPSEQPAMAKLTLLAPPDTPSLSVRVDADRCLDIMTAAVPTSAALGEASGGKSLCAAAYHGAISADRADLLGSPSAGRNLGIPLALGESETVDLFLQLDQGEAEQSFTAIFRADAGSNGVGELLLGLSEVEVDARDGAVTVIEGVATSTNGPLQAKVQRGRTYQLTLRRTGATPVYGALEISSF